MVAKLLAGDTGAFAAWITTNCVGISAAQKQTWPTSLRRILIGTSRGQLFHQLLFNLFQCLAFGFGQLPKDEHQARATDCRVKPERAR